MLVQCVLSQVILSQVISPLASDTQPQQDHQGQYGEEIVARR